MFYSESDTEVDDIFWVKDEAANKQYNQAILDIFYYLFIFEHVYLFTSNNIIIKKSIVCLCIIYFSWSFDKVEH